ncbi:MAG: DEAD/DEAH box helicase family protein [bacterium]
MKIPTLYFSDGTLILENWKEKTKPPFFQRDPRTQTWRALARYYSHIIDACKQKGISLQDKARAFPPLNLQMKVDYELYKYQEEGIAAWQQSGCCGSVILPTGSGKSLLAMTAMASINASTFVVAPTIDLMNQWYDRLTDVFGMEVGILGGGYHEIKSLTVSTYDSAYRYMDMYGNRFQLLIFDEIHHLPAPSYVQIPELSIAPYRLGLTATYECTDAQHHKLENLIGPVVYKKRIKDLKGQHLSEYEIHRIHITLTPQEKAEYDNLAESYKHYVREKGIRFYGRKWETFIQESSYVPEARKAMLAREKMRRILFSADRKMEALESVLKLHHKDRVIIFTLANDLVYSISTQYLIPAITHQTKTVERKAILKRFRQGEYRFIVTSKVLNEGVDVPEANVAVILGGTASPLEHIQRLGRILRKKSGKKAHLYEIVTGSTQETGISYRRRDSDAYS